MFKDFNLLSQSPVLPFETRSSRTHIHITGFAGLVKLGTVRNDVAAYWEKQDVEAFGAHIFEKELSVDQRLDGTPINPRRSQKNWGCICNVASAGGIELQGRVEIRALSPSGDLLLHFVQDPGQTGWPINQVDDRSFFQLEDRRRYAAGRTFGVGSATFMVEDTSPFDPDLMDLNIVQTGWGGFINSISYKGQVMDMYDHVWVREQPPKAFVFKAEGK